MMSYPVELPDQCGECGGSRLEVSLLTEMLQIGPRDEPGSGQISVTYPNHRCLDCGFEFYAWPGEVARDAAHHTFNSMRDGFHL
jgi:hypothetical protein